MNSIVARLFLLFLPTAAIVSGQRVGVAREHDAATPRQVVTGRVCMPDGSPAVGAVVTYAGGQAVTGADGSFAFEVDLSLDVESLEVTAVADGGAGAGGLAASTRLVPAALSPTVSVGQLVLTLSASCPPRWLPTFGEQPGMDDRVATLTVFDDGKGTALYAGGWFRKAGSGAASGIAKWNGSDWSALGSGVNTRVEALTTHDDGSGLALYAGGSFTTAGGASASGIAKWDGSSWSALGSGLGGGGVEALTVYDDGAGPALYAGGSFTTAGGAAANRIAKWDGSNWSALGSGLGGGGVWALTVYDDGSGPALIAGGYFTTADGVPANHIAKWDGLSWSTLGSGISGADGVPALTVYDDGGGPALYAGEFSPSGNNVWKWNGSGWSALALMNGWVLALTVDDGGGVPALYAGGTFTTAGGVTVNYIAKRVGSSWSPVGRGPNGAVRDLMVYDDGGGSALYAGGEFTVADGVTANRLAKWDGSSWAALGSGLDGSVHALTVYDNGNGAALYAGGDFSLAGGVSVFRIAKWDGTIWKRLRDGLNGSVEALTVHDDGGGSALYAAGIFTTADGAPANRIAKWHDSTWSALATGMNDAVLALTIFDDGSGQALYAGGRFTTAGGVTVNRLAKWDGSSWSALSSGLNGSVEALTVYDGGSGPALIAGGRFSTAGGVAANNVARWDGSSWLALGIGIGNSFSGVHALSVHDQGSGPVLLAGGAFVKRVAQWDGSAWLGLGFEGDPSVQALASWDDGAGPALYAGGDFTASPTGDSYLAKWGCRPKATVRQRKL